ncbi:MAG: dTDP-4-dehydrorhamnose reductase [Pseudomonadota bacterium]
MKKLVFGQTGQVARCLQEQCLAEQGWTFLDRKTADLSQPEACREAVLNHRPDIVINAAAWTAVDAAETDEPAATVVNGDAPGAMAEACADLNIPICHISSDYVFDGQGSTPFRPDDAPAPLGAYGRSKLAGEVAVRNSGARHLILRTSWVVSAYGANFVKTMLRLGAERPELKVVSDQIGGLTPAAAIATALRVAAKQMCDGHSGGTYHFAGAPDASWADIARAIMAEAGLPCVIKDIPSTDYPTPARRPLNSRLDCTSLYQDFGIERPDWRKGLGDILKDLNVR